MISIIDIIDILLVAILLFLIYKQLGKKVRNLFWGILVFVLFWSVAKFLGMRLTGSIFDELITSVAPIALIIIFQDEIRSFFYRMGSHLSFSELKRLFNRSQEEKNIQKAGRDVMQIVLACKSMSNSHTGALIIFARNQSLGEYIESGEQLNAKISARLIENIFFKNTPLHDGAMIIEQSRIVAAACILPVSKNQDIPQSFGLRHRAALGLSEHTDALSVVVSEETGNISVAENGVIKEVDLQELENTISKVFEKEKKD